MSKVKIPKIQFNNRRTLTYLESTDTNEKVYFLSAKRFPNRIHEVASRHLSQGRRMCVHVRFVKTVEICESTKTTHPFFACQPIDALDQCVKQSGFDTTNEWLETVRGYSIPEYPKTRKFYLHFAVRL
jgi:hypothetical protein